MSVQAISRRRFLQVGAGGMAVLALGACGDREDVQRLTWLNWQDYVDPAVVRDFERATGIKVSYETYESNDELEAKLIQASRPRRGGRRGTTFDLIVPSDNFVVRFARLGLLAELDHGALDNLGNLRGDIRDADFDPGNRYTVPWATGTTGIGYDSSVFPEAPDYEVFLNEEHAGRMTVLNEIRDAFGLALFSLGLDPNTTTSQDIDEAADRLIEMKGVIRGFDSDSYLDDLASGELVAAHAYSSDLLLAKQSNDALEFTLPSSGALRWVDSLAIPEDAPHQSNAERFVDYFLQPEVSARISEAIQADTGNEAAVEELSSATRDNPIIFPPEDVVARLVFTQDLGEAEDLYVDAWARVQDA